MIWQTPGDAADNQAGGGRDQTTPMMGERSARQSRNPRQRKNTERRLQYAVGASWATNWLLLAIKIYAFSVSGSKAVLASMADSAVDLASQLVISVADYQIQQHSPYFPVGRSRLEALAVIGCACIMSIASLEVVQFSALDLYNGFVKGQLPDLDLSVMMYCILGFGTVLKLVLFWYCSSLKEHSDSVGVLAEDHLNDVMSNLAAMLAALITHLWHAAWWADASGAIVISLAIIWRWSSMTYEQVLKIVGHAAPEDFVSQVEQLARDHHPSLLVDVTRSYHFGARFNVEMEIVLPGDMTVAESHDIALELQHKIEARDDVERAFVHVDYQPRNLPEHKVERTLLLKHSERRASGRLWGGAGAAGARAQSPAESE